MTEGEGAKLVNPRYSFSSLAENLIGPNTDASAPTGGGASFTSSTFSNIAEGILAPGCMGSGIGTPSASAAFELYVSLRSRVLSTA